MLNLLHTNKLWSFRQQLPAHVKMAASYRYLLSDQYTSHMRESVGRLCLLKRAQEPPMTLCKGRDGGYTSFISYPGAMKSTCHFTITGTCAMASVKRQGLVRNFKVISSMSWDIYLKKCLINSYQVLHRTKQAVPDIAVNEGCNSKKPWLCTDSCSVIAYAGWR